MIIGKILLGKGSDVYTAAPDNDVEQIARMLAEKKIGVVVIVEGDQPVGIVSERDLVRAIAGNGHSAVSMRANEIMTKNLVTCLHSDDINTLMNLMTDHRIRHVPVVENGKLAGLISIGDVVKARIAEAEFEAEQMKGYIASA